jgi:hypothetical protein
MHGFSKLRSCQVRERLFRMACGFAASYCSNRGSGAFRHTLPVQPQDVDVMLHRSEGNRTHKKKAPTTQARAEKP